MEFTDKHLANYYFTVDEGKLTFVENLGNADVLSISIRIIRILLFYKAFASGCYNARSDWIILGHYSLVMPTGRINTGLQTQSKKAYKTTYYSRKFGLYGKMSNFCLTAFNPLRIGQ